MSIQFDCLSIDNNAIHLVIDQLLPLLKYDSNSDFRVLDLENENVAEKHLEFYEEVFLPYCVEHRKHSLLHHYAGAFYPDTWFGEQSCLSMIHYLNQKAWWMLHYYAVKEAIQTHCKAKNKLPDDIIIRITSCMIDGNMSIAEAINGQISSEFKLEKCTREMIFDDIAQTVEKYRDAPSFPMVYR